MHKNNDKIFCIPDITYRLWDAKMPEDFVVVKILTRERIMTPIYNNEANLYRKYTSSSRARGWLKNTIESLNGQRCYVNNLVYHKPIFEIAVEFSK